MRVEGRYSTQHWSKVTKALQHLLILRLLLLLLHCPGYSSSPAPSSSDPTLQSTFFFSAFFFGSTNLTTPIKSQLSSLRTVFFNNWQSHLWPLYDCHVHVLITATAMIHQEEWETGHKLLAKIDHLWLWAHPDLAVFIHLGHDTSEFVQILPVCNNHWIAVSSQPSTVKVFDSLWERLPKRSLKQILCRLRRKH